MLWSIECQLQPARLWPLFARGETRRDANERYSIGWRTLGVVRKGGRGVWRGWRSSLLYHLVIAPCLDKLSPRIGSPENRLCVVLVRCGPNLIQITVRCDTPFLADGRAVFKASRPPDGTSTNAPHIPLAGTWSCSWSTSTWSEQNIASKNLCIPRFERGTFRMLGERHDQLDHTDRNVSPPEIESGSPAWQASIMPLDHGDEVHATPSLPPPSRMGVLPGLDRA